MIKECGVFEYSQTLLEHMTPGVFLTSAADGKRNTMIIGWGGISLIWGRPVMVVLIRNARGTHELVEKSRQFTVSVPGKRDLSVEITTCGTRSMRELGDKFAYCCLTPVPGRRVDVPVIGECDLHYECRVLYRQDLRYQDIPVFIKDRFYSRYPYPEGNHTLYFGEIVDTYRFEEE